MKKYDIINLLGKKFNFKSYLEISTLTTGYVYDKIDSNIFTEKCGIYYIPDTEEDTDTLRHRTDIDLEPNKYEYHHNKSGNKKIKYDIIFIDPWPTYTQTYRDLENALKLVSPNGIIVVHDCCPHDKSLIGSFKRESWCQSIYDCNLAFIECCGQTYEAFINFRYNYKELEIFCIDVDFGCGIISSNRDFSVPCSYDEYDISKIKDWKYFYENKKKLLNLIEPEKFIEYYNKI
jgi:hypothetical protein